MDIYLYGDIFGALQKTGTKKYKACIGDKKKDKRNPTPVAQLVGASFYTSKGYGHIHRLQVQSWVRVHARGKQ